MTASSGSWWALMADKTDPVEESAAQQETQDARLDRVEATQAEQGGKLDQILGLLQGDGESGGQQDSAGQESAADGAEGIAEQVRRAVEAVGAEKAAKEASEAHAAEHAALREAREKPPRESQSGFRGKLQRAMYGGDQ